MGPNTSKFIEIAREYASTSGDEKLKIITVALCDMYENMDKCMAICEATIDRISKTGARK